MLKIILLLILFSTVRYSRFYIYAFLWKLIESIKLEKFNDPSIFLRILSHIQGDTYIKGIRFQSKNSKVYMSKYGSHIMLEKTIDDRRMLLHFMHEYRHSRVIRRLPDWYLNIDKYASYLYYLWIPSIIFLTPYPILIYLLYRFLVSTIHELDANLYSYRKVKEYGYSFKGMKTDLILHQLTYLVEYIPFILIVILVW